MTSADNIQSTPALAAPRSPLSAEQIAQLRQSQIAGKKLRRARLVALIDGWSIAIFAGLTMLCGIFNPLSAGFMLGVGMSVVASVEFIGAGRLQRLHPGATRMLGFNQLAFATMLAMYALWNIYGTLSSHESMMGAEYTALAAQSPDAAQMVNSLDSLTRAATIGFYAAIIIIAIVVQGGTALYYITRGGHVCRYMQQTPGWIVELQRSGLL